MKVFKQTLIFTFLSLIYNVGHSEAQYFDEPEYYAIPSESPSAEPSYTPSLEPSVLESDSPTASASTSPSPIPSESTEPVDSPSPIPIPMPEPEEDERSCEDIAQDGYSYCKDNTLEGSPERVDCEFQLNVDMFHCFCDGEGGAEPLCNDNCEFSAQECIFWADSEQAKCKANGGDRDLCYGTYQRSINECATSYNLCKNPPQNNPFPEPSYEWA